MTWLAAFIAFTITVVASFPALIGAAMFGELLGEPDLRRAIAETGVEAWQLAVLVFFAVVPNLISGVFSGSIAFAVARRLVPAAETGAMVAAASGALLLHLLVSPLLFPESALMPKVVQVTGALIAYAAVALAMDEDMDELWRLLMRRAWTVLLVVAMIECAVVPITILEGLEAPAEEE